MILRYGMFALIGLATISLTITHLIHNNWWLVAAIVASAILWVVGSLRGVNWPSAAAFAVLSVAVGLAIVADSPVWLMFGMLLCVFVAWDIDHFTTTLSEVETLNQPYLQRVHFARLGQIITLAIVLSVFVLVVQTQLRPIWAILIGLFVIYGLSKTIRFLRQASD